MKKLQYSTTINAPKEKVWETLWKDASYRQWTKPFSETSYAVTDWQEGSKVQFLSGNGNGMYSQIARNIPNEFMSIRHIGEIKGGVEQPVDEKTKQWTGNTEDYTLKEEGSTTTLTVNLLGPEEFEGFFNDAFPKALQIVKSLSEQ